MSVDRRKLVEFENELETRFLDKSTDPKEKNWKWEKIYHSVFERSGKLPVDLDVRFIFLSLSEEMRLTVQELKLMKEKYFKQP